MPRRVQDIVPGHRTVRNTPKEEEAPKAARASATPKSEARKPKPEKEEEIPIHVVKRVSSITPPETKATPVRPRKKGVKKWMLVVVGLVVLVALAGIMASTYFSHATFSIVPKEIPVSVNGTYVAQATPGSGVLSYEVVTVHKSASSTIPASDGEQTVTKAQGKVTIYNTFSDATQRLVAGTRLTSPTGQIYRLTSSIVVPGSSTSGSSVVPGSITTDVIADAAGQDYNLSKSGFSGTLKLVGYQGTSKYDGFNAKLATDLSGGFVGTKKSINQALLASTTASLQAALTSSLIAQAKASVPKGFIMYDNAYNTSFTPANIGGTDPHMATVSVQGTLYGIVLKESDFVPRLAGDQAIASFGTFSYDTPGLDTLDFNIANIKDFSPDKKSSLVIHAKGNIHLIGVVPADQLKRKLAGLSLAETQDVFKDYEPVIETGSGELVPPWAHVPSDTSRISVEIKGQ